MIAQISIVILVVVGAGLYWFMSRRNRSITPAVSEDQNLPTISEDQNLPSVSRDQNLPATSEDQSLPTNTESSETSTTQNQ